MNSGTQLVLREGDAARLLGVSVAALRRWRREGCGPSFVHLERCVGYRIADLEAFIDANRVVPTPAQDREGLSTV